MFRESWFKRAFLWLILTSAPLLAQQASNNLLYGNFGAGLLDYRGTIGKDGAIGLTLVVDHTTTGLSGWFFHKNDLKDIPLTGQSIPGGIILRAHDPDGSARGQFHLQFATDKSRPNQSTNSQSLNFGNSILLLGTWANARGGAPLTVTLRQEDWVPGEKGHRYLWMNGDSDIERNAQAFYFAVLKADKEAAAKYVSYPLRTMLNGAGKILHDPEQFQHYYERIFTKDYVACLMRSIPHDMFWKNDAAMLGDGEVWFKEKGAVALNPCVRP
jgi:hypothetical protein